MSWKKKGEFESLLSESLGLKSGTPIMLEPLCTKVTWRLVRFPIAWDN